MKNSDIISIVTRYANSIEEFAESFKIFDAKIVQLSKGSFNGVATLIDLDDVSILRASSETKYQTQGWFFDNITFCFPLDSRPFYTSKGLIQEHSQPVSLGNCQFQVIYPDNFDHIVVSIKRRALSKYLSVNEIKRFEESIILAQENNFIQDCSALATQFICDTYSTLCLSKIDDNLKALSASRFSRLIIQYLFEYLSCNSFSGVAANSNYARILSRGFDVIDRHQVESLGLTDLSRQIYSSKRSIQYAFSKFIGMSPMEFIRTKRLNRIRRDLLCANNKELKVSDVLSKYKVSNQARFSQDYLEFFQELPKQTLSQS